MNVTVGAKSDVGRVRKGNEDAMLVDGPLFVVADGMGGHLAGDVASATAIETIQRRSEEQPPQAPSDLEGYIRAANQAIWEKALEDNKLQGMGTTCTLVFLDDATAHVAHVGDSRAYLLRSEELSQLTEDHTLVERMVREGKLQRDEAARHPQRSIITRALGVESDVEVDLSTFEVADRDRVLICSDGLSSMISDDAIADILRSTDNAETAAHDLVEAALEAGGEDNVTVVVLDFLAEGANSAPLPRTAARQDTAPKHAEDDVPYEPAPSRGRRWRKLIVALVVAAVLIGGAIAAANYTLGNSWFVGANEAGKVAIFTGIPDEIAGFSFREEEQASDLSIDELPAFLSSNVEEGIKVDSLEEAEATLANLEERASDFGEPSGTKDDGQKDGTNNDGGQSN
jgi:serine/threonine protein phosphatase PrpC